MGFTRPGFVMMSSIRQTENGSLIVGPNWPGNQLVYKIDPDRSLGTMALRDENERTLQLRQKIKAFIKRWKTIE